MINSSQFCNQNIDKYVGNYQTEMYADTRNVPSMVSASVIMFVLTGLFFNLNLFSSFSDVSAILDPKVRLFLSSALSIFLPVMSYIFSEAKNAAATTPSAVTIAVAKPKPDLSLRAGVILEWMLLVELLRKKMDEICMRGYSGTIQRAGRVAWLGSLVFFNNHSVGRKVVFGVLWILCATKLVQRIAFTEVGKRSYAYGKNARLVTSYMSQMLGQRDEASTHIGIDQAGVSDDHGDADDHLEALLTHIDIEPTTFRDGNGNVGDTLLMRSKLLVMGEEDLVIKPTDDGYNLKEIVPDDTVVTVGKIWCHVSASRLDQGQRLRRLCLSFALFKLLRRRFEHLPVTKEETHECRSLILNGIYNNKEENVEALFQIMNDEVNFLSEYYHSVIPVVLASPNFFLINYFLLPVVVLSMCLITVVICGNGDARYAFHSIKTDNFAISSGVLKTTMCLLIKAFNSPRAFFTTVDFFVTFLLFLILCYEEIWEFLVFLLSNWFMVSLLRDYVAKPQWRASPMFTGAIRCILWVRDKMSHPVLSFNQFSLLGLRWPHVLGMPTMFSLLLQTVPVPNQAKHSIIKSLLAHSSHVGNSIDKGVPLNNGESVLVDRQRDDLLPACRSKSIAEVILTWHIATTKCSPRDGNGKQSNVSQTVATRLSRYCAYLVAFHPELLPKNQDNAEHVFESAKAELKHTLGSCCYYLSYQGSRVEKITAVAADWKDGEVVNNGAKLGNMLSEEATRDGGSQQEQTWKLLADVWTEIVVYLAPSSDEEHVLGHESVLVQGGEFITVLWALTTQTGITRT